MLPARTYTCRRCETTCEQIVGPGRPRVYCAACADGITDTDRVRARNRLTALRSAAHEVAGLRIDLSSARPGSVHEARLLTRIAAIEESVRVLNRSHLAEVAA